MNTSLLQKFNDSFHHTPESVFSAPGRTELGGNHTDHQHGLVLAAAVNLDTRAAVSKNGTDTVRLISEGFPACEISLSSLEKCEAEQGSTAALIRGVAAGLRGRGAVLSGFDACVTSSVLPGGGLSSSAAFEILTGTIFNTLFCDSRFSPLELALIGKYAENEYYGKPSGLMDQLACSCGGCMCIDFADTEHPVIEPVGYDFSASGYKLCIVNSGADHRDLTGEYAAITEELARVCGLFGKRWLREVPEEDFYARLREVSAAAGDRAALRAIHVYEENRRVRQETEALKRGDFEEYLRLVRASGASSWEFLQNVIPCGRSAHQEMALTLAAVSHLLKGRGACRVQGGGFAGAIQVYVPEEQYESFTRELERCLGRGRCTEISVRNTGGTVLQTLT